MQKCIQIFKFFFRGNILAKGNQIQIKVFKENQLNLLSQFWSLGMKFLSTSQHICISESLFLLSEPLQRASCALFIMLRPGAIGGIGSQCCWNSPLPVHLGGNGSSCHKHFCLRHPQWGGKNLREEKDGKNNTWWWIMTTKLRVDCYITSILLCSTREDHPSLCCETQGWN